jgi:hypothetical protein
MTAPISNPTLPPIAGYVEVEVDGTRQYQKIQTEADAEIAALREQNATLQSQVNQLADMLAQITGVTP